METNEMSAESLSQLAEITSLKHRNYELQREIEYQRNYITFLKDKIEKLSEKPKKEIRYDVVRSFNPASGESYHDLEKYFRQGWEFVRASDYIERNGSYSGYIEYILKKEVEVDND